MAAIKTIDQVCREINQKFEDVVKKGFTQKDLDELKQNRVSLGSISLDWCLYGGLKEGTFVEFSGAASAGKSSTAFLAAGSYQRTHPDRSVLYLDLEDSFDPVWADKLGLNTIKQFIYYKNTEGQSGEVILNHVVEFIKTGEVGFVVIDSLPMLIPDFVQTEDDMNQKSIGGNAKLLSDFTSRYTGLISKHRVIVIGINQVRDNMTKYGDPLTTPGGRAWKHACSTRLMFKRGEFFDQQGEKVKKKDAQSPAGHIIEMYVLKDKNSPWDRKLGFTKLHYWKGIDYISDLTEVAIYFGLIESVSAAWYRILDENKKPLLENGEEIKINGKKKLAEYLKDHKEISRRLYDTVKDLMAVKEPDYIKGFEDMLGAGAKETLANIPEGEEEE